MRPYLVDVPVLLIFWARPEQFKQTFEAVRKARPSTLLLWQDGPRSDKDLPNIEACRKIVEDIDWECTVYRKYNESNFGCDPSTHYSHKWAFSIVEKCIILEDDLIASQSFFTFCKAMLDKYENDQRIDRICGINILGQYDCGGADYFFMRNGSSWGWATWKRVADKWESDYHFLDNQYAMNLTRDKGKKNIRELKAAQHRTERIPYWEFIVGYETRLNSRLCIYPRVNMIKNVGMGENATHAAVAYYQMPKYAKQQFFRPIYELSEPFKDPEYMIHDYVFSDRIMKIQNPNFFVKQFRRLESLFYKLLGSRLHKSAIKK